MKMFTTSTAVAALIISAAAAPAFADGHTEKTMHKSMVKAKSNVSFETVDANGDMRLDFTEFSNHFEKNHGWSAADSAIKFTEIADDSGTVTKDAFMMIAMDKMPTDMMSSGNMTDNMKSGMTTSHNMSGHHMSGDHMSGKMDMMETTTTTTVVTSNVAGTGEPVMRERRTETRTTSYGSGALLNLGTMVDYGQFSDYDRNSDGMVSFSEYSRLRSNAGNSATQSAQEFIRLSDGQSNISQARFNSAVSMNVLGN